MPAPPPVPAVLVVAGTDHHTVVADLVEIVVPTLPATAYLVLRGGSAAGAAYIPGHREPREVTAAGLAAGPPTRPPRRVELRRPVELLHRAEFVVAPPAAAAPAGTEILADAVRRADGLLYVLDATVPLAPDRRDELAAAAAAARHLVLVDTRDATAEERQAITRQVPAVAAATWLTTADLAAVRARCADWPRPSPVPLVWGKGGPVRATDDDVRWRATLDRELRTRSAALRQQVATDLAALETRCATEPGGLPAVLDTELHALSLRTTDALERTAVAVVRSVFGQVVAGELTEPVVARVLAALRAAEEAGPPRTLLVTATAGVASVTGSSAALSVVRHVAPTVLPPVAVAVSGNCHLMWHYRGVPDKAEARRWLHQVVGTLERELGRGLAERFTALEEAVGGLAAEAVDHGVLLA